MSFELPHAGEAAYKAASRGEPLVVEQQRFGLQQSHREAGAPPRCQPKRSRRRRNAGCGSPGVRPPSDTFPTGRPAWRSARQARELRGPTMHHEYSICCARWTCSPSCRTTSWPRSPACSRSTKSPKTTDLRPGRARRWLYVILQGRVRIATTDNFGRERVLAFYGPGEFFGDMAVLTGAPRSATASASTDRAPAATAQGRLRHAGRHQRRHHARHAAGHGRAPERR